MVQAGQRKLVLCKPLEDSRTLGLPVIAAGFQILISPERLDRIAVKKTIPARQATCGERVRADGCIGQIAIICPCRLVKAMAQGDRIIRAVRRLPVDILE